MLEIENTIKQRTRDFILCLRVHTPNSFIQTTTKITAPALFKVNISKFSKIKFILLLMGERKKIGLNPLLSSITQVVMA